MILKVLASLFRALRSILSDISIRHAPKPFTFSKWQVVHDKLPVSIQVLCDILEYFCGSFIISMNIQSKGFLHDVVLPCRWLLLLLKDVEECYSRDTRLLYLLVDSLAELSTQIYSTGL
jgi:hypothetical protein